MSDRYFTNNYEDYNDKEEVTVPQQFIKDLIKKYVKEILQNTDPKLHKINSRSRPDLYVGLSGIAFMFLKLSQSELNHEYPALELAENYSRNAEEILKGSGSRKYISLLSGNAGVYIVSAAVNEVLGTPVNDDIRRLLKGTKIFQNPDYLDDGQDEMLVGRCGYILGIQWLQNQIKSHVIPLNEMQRLANIVIKSGRSYTAQNKSTVPLMYQYHRREYLGAAHGISAILFSLLDIQLEDNDLKDVKTTIDAILDLQDDDGNFPSKFNKSEAHLVHWCHGAPGIIYLMAKAYKVFKEEKYLNSCIKCGELVWQKGLLKKGPGICHGIASSGYVHLVLYRLTNERKYLYRAIKFAEFLTSDTFREAREPDRPYSLFEGLGGTVCFLLDLLQPQSTEFPFMNVFVSPRGI